MTNDQLQALLGDEVAARQRAQKQLADMVHLLAAERNENVRLRAQLQKVREGESRTMYWPTPEEEWPLRKVWG